MGSRIQYRQLASKDVPLQQLSASERNESRQEAECPSSNSVHTEESSRPGGQGKKWFKEVNLSWHALKSRLGSDEIPYQS